MASVIVYIAYNSALNAFDGGKREILGPKGTAGIWTTFPHPHVSSANAFLDQFIGTALLVLMNLAITDKKNTDIPHAFEAILMGFNVFSIGTAYGSNSGGAANPARDFAPRLFLAMAGWGSGVFSEADRFFWIPLVAPFFGAFFAAFIYAFFIKNHWLESDLTNQLSFQPSLLWPEI